MIRDALSLSGTRSDFTDASAHSGKTTGLVGADIVFSDPPKPLDETASPEAAGFKVPTTEAAKQIFLSPLDSRRPP